jgi:hypothetical protein
MDRFFAEIRFHIDGHDSRATDCSLRAIVHDRIDPVTSARETLAPASSIKTIKVHRNVRLLRFSMIHPAWREAYAAAQRKSRTIGFF